MKDRKAKSSKKFSDDKSRKQARKIKYAQKGRYMG
tara:strand:+ start:4630 stop:4734 length:105 start_codon:yes stop_codon:yes gene_type:complete